MDATAREMRPLFAGGVVVTDALEDLIWERNHGLRKRVSIVAEIICKSGWATQRAIAQRIAPADAPPLTPQSLMLLVDQGLAAAGSDAACTRSEIDLALAWLTNPLEGRAFWNDAKTAVVVEKPL